MEFLKKSSIRTKIIGMVMAVVLLLSGGGLFSMLEVSKSYEKSMIDAKMQMATTLGERISAQFFERYGDAQAFAMNPILQSGDPQRISRELDAYVKLYGIYDLIILADKEGRFISSNSVDASGAKVNQSALDQVDYSKSDWFQAVVQGKTTDDPKKGFVGTFFEPFLKDPYLKQAFGELRLSSGFSAPVKNSKGEVVAVLSNRAGSRWIEREFVDMFSSVTMTGTPNVGLTLVDSEGLTLIHHQPSVRGGKNEIAHDFENMLFSASFVTPGSRVEEALRKRSNSTLTEVDPATGERDYIGSHFIDNGKWISSVGWTVFVHEDEASARGHIDAALAKFYIIFGVATALALVVSIWFGLSIGRQFQLVTDTLGGNSSDLLDASSKIASSATELSEAATEQAAALQETVAAVDEISAMVDKNAEAANRSKDKSSESRSTAEKGKRIIENMLRSIDEIDQSNSEISSQMDQTNRELSEITKLMSDIQNKTKVINEIVFQTKLLSFNASVEAARAGEYGKGFAVVAEEVGNLAQMSGNAAKDITTMLEDSVRKVDGIISDTKAKVERLMAHSKEKVKSGSETAKEASEALEEIIVQVATVDSLVTEIAVASNEQSTGIREISKAVGQMEQVTQQNSTVAQHSSVSAEQLRAQATSLASLVGDLSKIVHGASAHARSNVDPVESASNVISMQGRVKRERPSSQEVPVSQAATKKAVGDEGTPSYDDPGFKDE